MPLPKLKVLGVALTSVESLSDSVSVMFAVGSLVKTTLKLSVVPLSLRVAVVFDRVRPTVSLSVVTVVRL